MPSNIIVIMTDELRRDCLGCYGAPMVRTPHIDALAARGMRFDAAYTPSPICVPARASIATGRYVHEIGYWSNAQPYHGEPRSWHHGLRDAGREMLSIGKLHFRGTEDDNGFTREINPLHVVGGEGWIHGLLRDEEDIYDASGFAAHIGPGDDPYTQYDEAVCEATVEWIRSRTGDDPWCLYVSFLRPHYPLTCPPEFYEMYDPAEVPMPRAPGPADDHPILAGMRRACDYDTSFTDETRRVAIASYYGLCSFVDAKVGEIMGALEDVGAAGKTAVIFTSDHGECLGDRGFWTKMVMYEEASAVPLIVAGPGIAPGVVDAPVSLIDLYPTVLQLSGVADKVPPHARSLLDAPDPDRAILSEYHDYGAKTGMLMLRKGRWKLVVYPGYAEQLFDLHADPRETRDLAGVPDHARTLAEMRVALREIADPEEINTRAFADQAVRIEELGGRDAIRARENYDHTPVNGC
ncbi:MAG: sulfatase-like hydrolase/transferase [Pseudomonadota bacterium]